MKEFWKALRLVLVCVVLLGIVYPLVTNCVSRVIFPFKSSGSIVYSGGNVVGSELIGQEFTENRWFTSRPSKNKYYGLKSGGTNINITSSKFKKYAQNNIDEFLSNNPQVKRKDIPQDMITASASGIDPDISYISALLQVKRIAKENKISENGVKLIIEKNVKGKFLGMFGEKRVNVLKLNLDLLKEIKK